MTERLLKDRYLILVLKVTLRKLLADGSGFAAACTTSSGGQGVGIKSQSVLHEAESIHDRCQTLSLNSTKRRTRNSEKWGWSNFENLVVLRNSARSQAIVFDIKEFSRDFFNRLVGA